MSGDRVVVEIEVLEGLRAFVLDELAEVAPGLEPFGPSDHDDAGTAVRGALPVDDLAALLGLRCAVAAHLVLRFDVPRPRSLLSPDHLASLASGIASARALHGRKSFRSFRISAAGADSDDFVRLKDHVAETTGLARDDADGDLLLRFRRSRVESSGWDVLVRLSPRPLSSRSWRAYAFPGSLNATVAAAMIRAIAPMSDDRMLDPMCGSGTLVIERLAVGAPARLVASDIDALVVDGVARNQRAARFRGRVERAVSDGRALPHPSGSFDVICTNLPWGTSTGSHEQNRELYPSLLAELRRVMADGGRAALLTHEVTVFEEALRSSDWMLVEQCRIFQKGHHPRMYLLRPR